MTTVTARTGSFTVNAYQGDLKTLLAFNFSDKKSIKNLAGFSIRCEPQGLQPYYLQNYLQFATPGTHSQSFKEPANSTLNAPIQKFRWLHVPGSAHQGIRPVVGLYIYTVTPRYFDAKGSLLAIDPELSVTVHCQVGPFQKNGLEVGFTRGFVQSQAFIHQFGLKALIRPKQKELLYNTAQLSGVNSEGVKYTYQDEYEWLGFSARQKIFTLLNDVLANPLLQVDVFAYDLTEPDIIGLFLKLAAQGRIRIILDNALLHHNATGTTPEDEFSKLFNKAAKGKAALLRGKFGRYAHDKIMIVSHAAGATKVLTGSTNFSVTGLYVNSNHVLIFNDTAVANTYLKLFNEVWNDQVQKAAYLKSAFANQAFEFSTAHTPKTEITFAPHTPAFATTILQNIANRVEQEGKQTKAIGNVFFAVMEIDNGTSPVYTALKTLHKNRKIFSYGISDSPGGIYLYPSRTTGGVLVTGKPINTLLPPPFNQVPSIGIGHQVHHKFVVCGFNSANPVVYCGSSNLALGGEAANGDNLLAIHDSDVATVFTLEALALVDHFNFLDHLAQAPKTKKSQPVTANKQQAAVSAGWFLNHNDNWAKSYFNPQDLHCVDRKLFGEIAATRVKTQVSKKDKHVSFA